MLVVEFLVENKNPTVQANIKGGRLQKAGTDPYSPILHYFPVVVIGRYSILVTFHGLMIAVCGKLSTARSA